MECRADTSLAVPDKLRFWQVQELWRFARTLSYYGDNCTYIICCLALDAVPERQLEYAGLCVFQLTLTRKSPADF